MRRQSVVALVAVAAAVAALASGAGAAPRSPRAAQFYLDTATHGLTAIQQHWWDDQTSWYFDTYNHEPPSMPLARLWSAFPVFETLIGMQIGEPSAENKAALETFAASAGRLYWNPLVKPVGGYDWYPNYAKATGNLYYDDSGWWGLAYTDAYRVLPKPAYLTWARRALVFITTSGWDKAQGGGTWWDTGHDHKTIEPLAAAALIATRLYEAKHKPADLKTALNLLGWADAHSFDAKRGLYTRSATDGTVMDYVQGLMAVAKWSLCKDLKRQALCTQAKKIANSALAAFPHDLDWSPQFDVVYLRWMLEYGQMSGDGRFYQLAADNAERALAVGRNGNGYFENRWDGTVVGDGLAHQAANLELMAWLGATAPKS